VSAGTPPVTRHPQTGPEGEGALVVVSGTGDWGGTGSSGTRGDGEGCRCLDGVAFPRKRELSEQRPLWSSRSAYWVAGCTKSGKYSSRSECPEVVGSPVNGGNADTGLQALSAEDLPHLAPAVLDRSIVFRDRHTPCPEPDPTFRNPDLCSAQGAIEPAHAETHVHFKAHPTREGAVVSHRHQTGTAAGPLRGERR